MPLPSTLEEANDRIRELEVELAVCRATSNPQSWWKTHVTEKVLMAFIAAAAAVAGGGSIVAARQSFNNNERIEQVQHKQVAVEQKVDENSAETTEIKRAVKNLEGPFREKQKGPFE